MILVTGGAGFIGSNICADLEAAGRQDIVVADTLGHEGKWRNIAKRNLRDVIFPVEIEPWLAGRAGLDAVIHMGADSSTTVTDGDHIIRNNFRLSTRLWDWCAGTGTPFIYASSAATYGDGTQGFDDAASPEALARLRPLNLYGWSKQAFDRWAMARAAEGHAPPQWAGLKFFNVFGPNEAHKGDMRSLVAKTARRIAAGETITLFRSHRAGIADGEQKRDFVSVKDCCAAVTWLFENPGVSGLFNLGTGRARSFRDLMLAVGTALGVEVDIAYAEMPKAIRDQYQYFTEARMEKLRSAGFVRPFATLEDSVADYVRNYLLAADEYR
jgi:ADP-L-glycero-D-manno-heptose 6-epimerase